MIEKFIKSRRALQLTFVPFIDFGDRLGGNIRLKSLKSGHPNLLHEVLYRLLSDMDSFEEMRSVIFDMWGAEQVYNMLEDNIELRAFKGLYDIHKTYKDIFVKLRKTTEENNALYHQKKLRRDDLEESEKLLKAPAKESTAAKISAEKELDRMVIDPKEILKEYLTNLKTLLKADELLKKILLSPQLAYEVNNFATRLNLISIEIERNYSDNSKGLSKQSQDLAWKNFLSYSPDDLGNTFCLKKMLNVTKKGEVTDIIKYVDQSKWVKFLIGKYKESTDKQSKQMERELGKKWNRDSIGRNPQEIESKKPYVQPNKGLNRLDAVEE